MDDIEDLPKEKASDLLPKNPFSITIHQKKKPVKINPLILRDIPLSLFGLKLAKKWVTISGISNVTRVCILYFDGLDSFKTDYYKEYLPIFETISLPTFPGQILSTSQGRRIIPLYQSFFGIPGNQTFKKQFSSFSEMVATMADLIDNGFPVPLDISSKTRVPLHLRCQHFHNFHPFTPEELSECISLPDPFPGYLPVISLDCEMIQTTNGDEVARLSVVDQDENTIFDEYFKPIGEVIDYRTEFSGITEESFKTSKHYSNEASKLLGQFASKETIIIGHSLENDFHALKLIHLRVIDTSLIFNLSVNYPYKSSLAKLLKKYFDTDLRDENIKGHDSIADSIAALKLAKLAMSQPCSRVRCPPQIPELFKNCLKSISSIHFLAEKCFESIDDFNGIDSNVICNFLDEDDIVENIIQDFKSDNCPSLISALFGKLAFCNLENDLEIKICQKINEIIQNIVNNMPKKTVLMVIGGNGNKLRYAGINNKETPENIEQFELSKSSYLWVFNK